MTAGTQNITLEIQASFRMSLIYRNPSTDGGVTPGTLFDLTGYTAQMEVRPRTGIVAILEPVPPLIRVTDPSGNGTDGSITLGGTAGTISIYLTGDQTADLTGKKAVYDLYILSSSGEPTRLLEGAVTINPTATVLA